MKKYLDKVSDEQELLANISDIVMQVYAMESVLLRVEKNLARDAASEVAVGIVRAYVQDTMARVEIIARDILSAIAEGDTLRTYLSVLKRLTKSMPLHVVAMKRSVADELIKQGGYAL